MTTNFNFKAALSGRRRRCKIVCLSCELVLGKHYGVTPSFYTEKSLKIRAGNSHEFNRRRLYCTCNLTTAVVIDRSVYTNNERLSDVEKISFRTTTKNGVKTPSIIWSVLVHFICGVLWSDKVLSSSPLCQG